MEVTLASEVTFASDCAEESLIAAGEFDDFCTDVSDLITRSLLLLVASFEEVMVSS